MELIETYTSKNNKTYEIYYSTSFKDNDDIYEWFLVNCQKLCDDGYALKNWPYREMSWQGIVAINNRKLVGHYAVRADPEMKLLANNFCYVDPAHRKQGLVEPMLRSLSKWGLANGYLATTSEVHNKSTDMNLWKSKGYEVLPFYQVIHVF